MCVVVCVAMRACGSGRMHVPEVMVVCRVRLPCLSCVRSAASLVGSHGRRRYIEPDSGPFEELWHRVHGGHRDSSPHHGPHARHGGRHATLRVVGGGKTVSGHETRALCAEIADSSVPQVQAHAGQAVSASRYRQEERQQRGHGRRKCWWRARQ